MELFSANPTAERNYMVESHKALKVFALVSIQARAFLAP
jgi:hypothetical protein